MVNFNTLIDTGAVDASFISVGAAKILAASGYEVIECRSNVEMGVKDLSQPILGKFENLEILKNYLLTLDLQKKIQTMAKLTQHNLQI